ncbi:hypothetical protein AMELA_G00048890 [Ameiurus melas]|uniref:Uncharacterized protein n=1 Tax=Ameiurus melas TaxID=219545 RepID=A0A7J6B5A3_AMEME|nr:hypothetical protein AMELA_G00048890 [Ameiurus melas]
MITSSRGAIHTSLISEQNLARVWLEEKEGRGQLGPSVDGMRRSEKRLSVTSAAFLKVNNYIRGVRGQEARRRLEGGEASSRFALAESLLRSGKV